jgi:hypothetical protein
MRKIVAIFILIQILPSILYGQLLGDYYHLSRCCVERINFIDSNRFDYSYSRPNFIEAGHGTYSIEDSSLILRFQFDPRQAGFATVNKVAEEDSKNITINISAEIKNSHEYIGLGTVRIEDNNGKIVKIVFETDLYNKFKYELPKSKDSLILMYSSFDDYWYPHTFNYKFIPDSSFDINITMNARPLYNNQEGDELFFKMRNLRKKSVELIHDWQNSKFEKFKKKNSKKGLKRDPSLHAKKYPRPVF